MGGDASRRVLIACAFVAAGAGLRFFHLENQPLWNDEMFSLEVATAPVSAIQSSLAAQYHHPPLFFYLLHFALSAFGPSAWALRLISAAAGSLTVGLVFWWCSGMFGMAAGLVSGALCLVAPFHLAYSQEGRPYALAACLALTSCCSFPKLLTARNTGSGLVYAVSSLALLYTHHWGIFVLASHVVYAGLQRGSLYAASKGLLLSWIAIVILYLPEVPTLMHQSGGGSPSEWFWVESPGWREPLWLAGAYSGTYFRMASSVFDGGPVERIAGVASAIAFVAAAAVSWFRNPESTNLRVMLACLGGTLLIPYLISYVKPEVFLWYRYTVIAFPLFCVAIGALSTSRIFRGRVLLLPALLLAAGAMGSYRYYSWSKSNVRDVAVYADSLARSGAGILIRPRSFAPLLNYYYHGAARQVDEAYLDNPLGELVDTAAAFVYVSLDVPNGIRTYMDGHFSKGAERRFPGEAHMGMIVTLYRQPPGAGQ